MRLLSGMIICLSSVMLLGCQLSKQPPIGAQILPPSYLTVSGFKKCLATQKVSTWRAWCLPKQKPDLCEATSWKELVKIGNQGGLNPCKQ